MQRIGIAWLLAVGIGSWGCGSGSDDPAPTEPFEPNDSFAGAAAIQPGTYDDLAIDPATDEDFFRFSLATPRNVTIDCLFTTSNGDLDLFLYDGSESPVAVSAGAMDDEHIVRTDVMGGQLGAGDYFIRVRGYQRAATNEYSLVLTIE